MEAVRSSWTDDRLDLLNERVEERFDQVDRRFDEMDRRFGHVDARLGRLETQNEAMTLRLDSIQRAMIYGVITLTGGMIAGFSAMIVLIATQV
jgi:hypothetical protein